MAPKNRPRIALVQSHWREHPNDSLKQVLGMLEEIDDTDFVVLPEFFLGPPYYFPGREMFKGLIDQPVPGPAINEIAKIARAKGFWILCGTIVEREIGAGGENYYNTAVLIDDHGEIVGKARKIHRFAAEMLTVTPGTDQLLVDTPFGRVGVCVCSDFWLVEMPRMLALRGAEIIVVPGAALVGNLPITRPCIQANSSFNVCYTLLAGAVGSVTGERAGRQVSIAVGGYTTAAGPENIIGTLEDEEKVLYCELDMDYLRRMREVDLSFTRSLYWCLHGRLPELYGDISQAYVGSDDLESLITNYLTKR
ncbi:MAG: carbon-nitrogen hydrolase family protein [Pseudonocardiaceae bacterium]